MSIAILGAGAFGTALSIALARTGPVTLWARDATAAQEMQTKRTGGRRLPDATLPDPVTVTADIQDTGGCDLMLLCVPTQRLRDLTLAVHSHLNGVQLVACCKGIERDTGLGPVRLLSSVFPGTHPALLTGPSFAVDLAAGLPTALTLACADPDIGTDLQTRLSTPSMRLYRSQDTIGAELGGALKNVIAIACGAIMGANLGDSARAALMTRGYAEMQRVALSRGARAETLSGLSGFGDLALTCTSEASRNYRLGLALGREDQFDPDITVEGAATARALVASANVDLPIAQTVVHLLDGDWTMAQAVETLLARPLKEE
ncbi:MAG: NAD(P)H-dependent glycerol-3-phosphate dehydrogenase [Pseudomonadota bacterium]